MVCRSVCGKYSTRAYCLFLPLHFFYHTTDKYAELGLLTLFKYEKQDLHTLLKEAEAEAEGCGVRGGLK